MQQYYFTSFRITKLDNGWVLQYSYADSSEIPRENTPTTKTVTREVSGSLAFPNHRLLFNWINSHSVEQWVEPEVVHATPVTKEDK